MESLQKRTLNKILDLDIPLSQLPYPLDQIDNIVRKIASFFDYIVYFIINDIDFVQLPSYDQLEERNICLNDNNPSSLDNLQRAKNTYKIWLNIANQLKRIHLNKELIDYSHYRINNVNGHLHCQLLSPPYNKEKDNLIRIIEKKNILYFLFHPESQLSIFDYIHQDNRSYVAHYWMNNIRGLFWSGMGDPNMFTPLLTYVPSINGRNKDFFPTYYETSEFLRHYQSESEKKFMYPQSLQEKVIGIFYHLFFEDYQPEKFFYNEI